MRKKRGRKKKSSEYHCHFSTATSGRAQRVTSNIIVEVGVGLQQSTFIGRLLTCRLNVVVFSNPLARVARISLFFFTFTLLSIFVIAQIYLKIKSHFYVYSHRFYFKKKNYWNFSKLYFIPGGPKLSTIFQFTSIHNLNHNPIILDLAIHQWCSSF